MAAVAGKTESRTARFSAGPRHGTRQGPGRRRPRGPSAGEEEEPPVGCVSAGRRQSRSLRQQSHPTRFVAGAGNLWRASTHKGSPMFRRRAPARTTLGPRGLLTARLAASRREAPHGRSKTHRSREWRWARFGEQWPSRPVVRWRADGARTPLQKETRALESRAVRDVCLAASEVAGAAGGSEDQDALEAARRLRGALRRPVGDSIGNVPLQSG